jgi:hypothetical protein
VKWGHDARTWVQCGPLTNSLKAPNAMEMGGESEGAFYSLCTTAVSSELVTSGCLTFSRFDVSVAMRVETPHSGPLSIWAVASIMDATAQLDTYP